MDPVPDAPGGSGVSDVSGASDPPPSGPSATRAWLVYTGLRLAIFVGVAFALILFRVATFPTLFIALLVSSVLSLFLLRSQRDRVVAAQERRVEQRRAAKATERARLGSDPS